MYQKYIKRLLDFFVSLFAVLLLSPVLLLLAVIGIFTMNGKPFFTQKRPGKNEKIFTLIKFRTMLPDDDGHAQLTSYGRFLRKTSLDELPELFNILVGDMSLIGPRPQLVADMLFMTESQRKRHTVRPGLSGLAQINGRNDISWEEKFDFDLRYIENISFSSDFKILLETFSSVLKREGVIAKNPLNSLDLGEYLLEKGEISKQEFDAKLQNSKELLKI